VSFKINSSPGSISPSFESLVYLFKFIHMKWAVKCIIYFYSNYLNINNSHRLIKIFWWNWCEFSVRNTFYLLKCL